MGMKESIFQAQPWFLPLKTLVKNKTLTDCQSAGARIVNLDTQECTHEQKKYKNVSINIV